VELSEEIQDKADSEPCVVLYPNTLDDWAERVAALEAKLDAYKDVRQSLLFKKEGLEKQLAQLRAENVRLRGEIEEWEDHRDRLVELVEEFYDGHKICDKCHEGMETTYDAREGEV
jgi:chromosome segregation ATPase